MGLLQVDVQLRNEDLRIDTYRSGSSGGQNANCVVKFNFGPDFEFFPEDFDGRPVSKPLVEVPYHGFDNRVENGASSGKKH